MAVKTIKKTKITQKKISNLQVRLDSEFKKQLEVFFEEFGLTPTQAVVMFLKQVIREQAIPLNLKKARKVYPSDLIDGSKVDIDKVMEEIENSPNGLNLTDEEMQKWWMENKNEFRI